MERFLLAAKLESLLRETLGLSAASVARDELMLVGEEAGIDSVAILRLVVALEKEFAEISKRLEKSGLTKNIRVALIYVPLADKNGFVTAFDTKLKGLQ